MDAYPTLDVFLSKYSTEGKGCIKWLLEHYTSSLPIQTDHDSFNEVIDILNNHFVCIGLVERFDESIILMKNIFGWNIPLYKNRNTGSHNGKRVLPSREVEELFRSENRDEFRLYDYAVDRFNRLLEEFGTEMKDRLRRSK